MKEPTKKDLVTKDLTVLLNLRCLTSVTIDFVGLIDVRLFQKWLESIDTSELRKVNFADVYGETCNNSGKSISAT